MSLIDVKLPHEAEVTPHESISLGENSPGLETHLVVDPTDSKTYVVHLETQAARDAREAETAKSAPPDPVADEVAALRAELARVRQESADRPEQTNLNSTPL